MRQIPTPSFDDILNPLREGADTDVISIELAMRVQDLHYMLATVAVAIAVARLEDMLGEAAALLEGWIWTWMRRTIPASTPRCTHCCLDNHH